MSTVSGDRIIMIEKFFGIHAYLPLLHSFYHSKIHVLSYHSLSNRPGSLLIFAPSFSLSLSCQLHLWSRHATSPGNASGERNPCSSCLLGLALLAISISFLAFSNPSSFSKPLRLRHHNCAQDGLASLERWLQSCKGGGGRAHAALSASVRNSKP
jgi:hypothetical protein